MTVTVTATESMKTRHKIFFKQKDRHTDRHAVTNSIQLLLKQIAIGYLQGGQKSWGHCLKAHIFRFHLQNKYIC